MKRILLGLGFALILGGSAMAHPVMNSAPARASVLWNATKNAYQVPAIDAATGYQGIVCESGCGAGGGTVNQGTTGSAGSAWYVQPGTGATWNVYTSNQNTYIANFNVSPSAYGVVAQLQGSATKGVYVVSSTVTCNSTAAGVVTVVVNRTSTGSAAGTTTPSSPNDTSDAAATAVASYWTTPPTAGTLVAMLQQLEVTSASLTTAAGALNLNIPYSGPTQPRTLRGTGDYMQIVFSGTYPAGLTCNVTMVWYEQ